MLKLRQVSAGFPLPSVKWRDEDRVYMKPEHDRHVKEEMCGRAFSF
jgi:hypothetical protein